MKRKMCLVFVWLISVSISAQTPLSIATDKTTSLVFPFSILHVDRGTESILAQRVNEQPKVLLVKAAANDFEETNLSVVTDDGSVYSFLVSYAKHLTEWVHYIPIQQKTSLAMMANGILDNPKSMRGIKSAKWDIHFAITGIYIKEDVIFYQLTISNNSPIDYDIDLLKFYIKDHRKNKRTAIQENELTPLHISGNIKQVKAYFHSSIVIALDKFTIPDAKYLAVQLMEKNGGRHLQLRVNNRKIMKAIVLSDIK